MNQETSDQQKQATDSKSGDRAAPILATNTRESEKPAPKSTGQKEDPENLHQVTRWDRFKQWAAKITIAEAGMVFLTLVIAASGVLYTIFADRQWNVMSGQLAEMRDEQRPWLKDDAINIVSPLVIDNNALATVLEYRMKNVGHRPALDADFLAIATPIWIKRAAGSIAFYASPEDGIPDETLWPNINHGSLPKGLNPAHVDSTSAARMVCDRLFENNARKISRLTSTGGINFVIRKTTIFPDDEAIDNYRLYETEESLRTQPPESHSYIVGLTSCIEYQSADESTVHHEQSFYIVDGFDSLHPNVGTSLNPDGKPIPFTRLHLRLITRYAD